MQGESKILSFLFLLVRGKNGQARFSCMAVGMEKLSFDLLQAVKNVVGCGNLWDLWL